MKFSTEDPKLVRALSGNPNVTHEELYPAKSDGHKFKPGETRTLTGLVDFPEHNGSKVKITAIRKDGSNGKAYYVEGPVNAAMNWVYEYRLI